MRVYKTKIRTFEPPKALLEPCRFCHYGECERCVDFNDPRVDFKECPCSHWWTAWRKHAAESQAKAQFNRYAPPRVRQAGAYEVAFNMPTAPRTA